MTSLAKTLSEPPHALNTLTLSLDDLYLPHAAQRALAKAHPTNPLLQHRGQPSTHDIPLATSLFRALKARDRNIRVPSYDKSAHNGEGDRVPEAEWAVVNADDRDGSGPTVEVVIFEGWCVGFRPLENQNLQEIWERAAAREKLLAQRNEPPSGRLGLQALPDVRFINDALAAYDELTDSFDAFVFLDAEQTKYVYAWRLEQEEKLRRDHGAGMSDERVREFVDGYYPAYELFTERLREGIFTSRGEDGRGRQMRLVVGRDRKVVRDEVI